MPRGYRLLRQNRRSTQSDYAACCLSKAQAAWLAGAPQHLFIYDGTGGHRSRGGRQRQELAEHAGMESDGMLADVAAAMVG